jgi:hypothetical protein
MSINAYTHAALFPSRWPRQRMQATVPSHLLDEAELLALRLVEPQRRRERLLEPLHREDEQLDVVLVVQRRERDGLVLAREQPVHGRRVDRDRLVGGDIRAVLAVVVLPLLRRARCAVRL